VHPLQRLPERRLVALAPSLMYVAAADQRRGAGALLLAEEVGGAQSSADCSDAPGALRVGLLLRCLSVVVAG